jgi:hypothetical protein
LVIQQASAEVPANPPAPPNTSPPPVKPADSMTQLRALYRAAAERYAPMDSYVARVRRREQVNGKDKPEEVLLFKFRKEPWSVYFKFIGTEGHGREVVYVKGQYGNQIHTLLAAGDIPLTPAGRRMSVSLDNVFVRSASRHAITDAGIGEIIARFGRLLDYNERADMKYGPVKYVGRVKRPEFEMPLDVAEQGILVGQDPYMPKGGRRWLMFEPTTHLPQLVITHDDTGHEVEYICYDRLEYPVKLDDDDFNPDKLWPPERGRQTRATGGLLPGNRLANR